MSLIKNKKILASVISLLLLFVLFLPFISFAAGLVPCDGTTNSKCDFDAFIKMINGIINWIISMAGVIFTISLVYGGFLYATSGVKPGNKDKAKSILWNTLIGFVIILTAWLIVYTILINLSSDSSKFMFFLKK